MGSTKRTRYNVVCDSVSTAERLSMEAKSGVIVYDTDTTLFYKYNGSGWGAINDSNEIGTGWAQYADTVYNVGNKFTILQGVTSAIPNNAGANITSNLPTGVTAFYNGSVITPENVGDAYVIRVSFKTSNDNVSGLASLKLDIGGGQGVILDRTFSFPKGANTEVAYSTTSLVYSLGTFLANGGTMQVESVTGDTSIWDVVYVITRVHKA